MEREIKIRMGIVLGSLAYVLGITIYALAIETWPLSIFLVFLLLVGVSFCVAITVLIIAFLILLSVTSYEWIYTGDWDWDQATCTIENFIEKHINLPEVRKDNDNG